MKNIIRLKYLISFVVISSFFSTIAYSENIQSDWLSLKYDKTYLRTGPSKQHKVLWTYKKIGLPIKKLREKGDWLEVQMPDQETGWINDSQVSKKRRVIIISNKLANIYKKDNLNSKVVAKAGKNVTGDLIGCKNILCKINFYKLEGYIRKKNIWGID